MVVTVTGLDEQRQHHRLPGSERVTLGRGTSCEIRLPSAFISERHLIIEEYNGLFTIERVGENPSLLNSIELPIGDKKPLTSSDSVYVQGYLIQVAHDERATTTDASREREAFNNLLRSLHESIIQRLDPRLLSVEDVRTPLGRKGVQDVVVAELARFRINDLARRFGAREALRDSVLRAFLVKTDEGRARAEYGTAAQEFVRDRYAQALAAAIGLEPGEPARSAVAKVREHFDDAFETQRVSIPDDTAEYLTRWLLYKEVCDLMFELGPLTDLLRIPDITEIMVVSKDLIYIEIGGKIIETGRTFVDDSVSERIIERILAPINRRIDRASPMVDARLPDGSRVHAVIPPVAQKGPCITIRRFSGEPKTVEFLIQRGTLDPRAAGLLRGCVLCRKNIIISGGTGTGKTTLLNVLSSWIPDDERIVTAEDTAELQLQQRHVVSLEGRPMNIEQRGEITIQDLVRNALRMRPDRIVVGECRGPEALDMLQAMNTGHDGSLTTVHANNPTDVIHRLERMVLQAVDMPISAVRQQIGSAVDIVVQIVRESTGDRRISHITELVQDDGVEFRLVDIMRRRPDGRLVFTGHLPSFIAEIAAKRTLNIEEVVG